MLASSFNKEKAFSGQCEILRNPVEQEPFHRSGGLGLGPGVKCEMCAAASIQLGAKMYHLIQIKLILTLNQNSPRAME